MNLIYRGIQYNTPSTSVATVQSTTTATFRGQSYRVSAPVTVQPSPFNLIYRGVAYTPSTIKATPNTALTQGFTPAFN